VTAKPISSPADTELASAVFTTSITAQLTWIVAGPAPTETLALLADALLLIVPQLAAVVGETMWTDALADFASLPNEQRSTPPEIWQPARAGLMLQLVPAVLGSVSVTCTFVSADAPPFVTESV
jgi:hypothetical protein